MPNQDLTVTLIARIKNLISSSVIVPGSKLPPERELASHFGVSRPSLRQALKVLEIMGVISQRVGDGTYLNENVSDILNEPMEFLILMDGISIHELVELRSIMEPELAALAAERATVEDLRALERAINQHEASRHDLAKSIEADLNFHKAILRAAGNRACSRLLAFIHKSIWRSLSITSQLVEAQRPLAGHKAIYAAVFRRDSNEARVQMADHMRRAKLLLVEASKKPLDLSLARRTPTRGVNGVPHLTVRQVGSAIWKTATTSKRRIATISSHKGGRHLKPAAHR